MIYFLFLLTYVVAFIWLKRNKKYYIFFCFLILSVNPLIQKVTDPTLYGDTWFNFTLYRVTGDIFFIVFNLFWLLTEKIRPANNKKSSRLTILLAIWLITNLISLSTSIDIGRSSIIFLISVLGPTIFYFSAINALSEAKDKNFIYKSIALNMILHVAIGLVLFRAVAAKTETSDFIQLRAVGSVWAGNAALQILCMFFPLIFLKLDDNKRIDLLFKIGIFACIIIELFTSFSRTGFLVIFAMILLATIYKLMKRKWFIYLPVIILTIVNLIILRIRPELFDELHARFFGSGNSILNTVEGDSRLSLYNIAINNFQSFPFLGVGVSNFQLINPIGFSNTHNLFLNILIERGLINFIAFITLVFFLLKYNAKIIRLYQDIEVKKLFRAIKIGIILMLIYAITGDDLFTASGFTTAILSYFFYFVIAMHWVYFQRIKIIHAQTSPTPNV